MENPDLEKVILEMGAKARQAALELALLPEAKKNAILKTMASGLRLNASVIIAENQKDLLAAIENGLSPAMIDRLTLTSERIEAMASGIEQVVELTDPCGEILHESTRPNGMVLRKISVPIGAIGIVFESRPNVTSDAAVLCFKSGNATILRGGKEAIHSNRIIAHIMGESGAVAGLPKNAIQLIPFTERESVSVMAKMDKYLDLMIPRGGKGLVETVVSQARMPVIKHYDGICHMYVDKDADLEMAVKLVVDAKTQKPSVCNALETLIVNRDVAREFLPMVAKALDNKNTEIIGDEFAAVFIEDVPVTPATEEDWSTEYLDYKLSIKVVGSLPDAVDHINEYGSGHSDAIVTKDAVRAQIFFEGVDSACVYHNVSTRFSDGEEFGFGAEIGVSTDKIHARGPMGLKELTSYQYRISGNGQTKA